MCQSRILYVELHEYCFFMTWCENTNKLTITALEVLKYPRNVLKNYVESVNGEE